MGRLPALFKICNLRLLVVVVAAWFIIGSPFPHWLIQSTEKVNQAVFRIGLYFSELPPPRTPITVIHVPDLEYERWLVDLPGAKRLQQLLELLNKDDTVLGLILERPITLIQPEAESVLAEIQQGRTTNEHMYQEANAALARRVDLLAKLVSRHVVLGLENHQPSRYRAMTVRLGGMESYPQEIIDWLWPTSYQSTLSTVGPVLDYFPIVSNRVSSQFQYLYLKQKNNYIPSFWTQFMMASRAPELAQTTLAEHGDSVVWQRDSGFSMGEYQLKASPAGTIVPVYGRLSGVQSSLRQIGLSAALSIDDISGWVLIGRDSSKTLSHSAQILASLGDDAVMLEPLWWSPAQKLILAVLTMLLILIVSLASKRRALWSVVGMSMSLVVLQVGGQSLYGLWLPSGLSLIFIGLSYCVMFVWLMSRYRQQRILARADNANIELACHLLNLNDSDASVLKQIFVLLRSCQTSDIVLQKLYHVALLSESSSAYAQAYDIFKEVRRRKWRYQDVNAKLRILKSQLTEDDQRDKGISTDIALLPPPVKDSQEEPLEKTVFGRYEIERELGRGASGTVYLGFDPLISRQVAIKTLNYHQFSEAEMDDVKARFVREAEAAGRLNHPNIVPVFDVGNEDGAAYITMDFAQGAPLSDFIKEGRLLPTFEVYRIALNVAEALEYAHQCKIVHRDIKPGNILYCDSPFQVRITDFGIARIVDNTHTQTGEVLGSPLYMAPEQLLGHKVGPGADIFSLGVMFYQLLTGTLPFEGESLASLTYDIVHKKQKGARMVRHTLPASATRITNVALQKKAAERYPSAAAMADALRKAMKRDFAVEVKVSGCFTS